MKSLLSSKPETAYETRHMERTAGGAHDTDARRTPAAPGPLASFARFVLCGGGVGVVSSAAVAVLAALMPWAVANALITVASTVLCTELHARFTFGAGQRAGWRQHWQSAGSATAAYAVTCAAMLVLHLVRPSPGMLCEQAVYLSAAGLAGVGRFLILRLFVFATDRNRTRTQSATATTASASASASVRASSPARVRETSGSAPVSVVADVAVCSPLPLPARPSALPEAGGAWETENRGARGRSYASAGVSRCGARATTVPALRGSSRCRATRRPAPGSSPVRPPVSSSRNRPHGFADRKPAMRYDPAGSAPAGGTEAGASACGVY